LQLYAAAFFAFPAVRALLNARRNASIDERNASRSTAARLLNSGQRWLQEVRMFLSVSTLCTPGC
jgi:hypothetical protein